MYDTNYQNRDALASKQRLMLYVSFLPILFVLFGMSSWISVNTIWIEMPLLATALPEAWNLPSYVSVIIQFGNIGPLVMLLVRNKVRYSTIIYLIISWLIATNVVLAFVYQITTPIAGEAHSVAFLIEVFFMALCDCTSNVTFLPYMANFSPRYLVYFFIGQGLSGLVPSIFGLIQGSGSFSCKNATDVNSTNSSAVYPVYSPPRFDFQVFLFVAAGLLAISLLGFIALEIILRRLKVTALEEAKVPNAIPATLGDRATPLSEIINLPHLDPFASNKTGSQSFVTTSETTVQYSHRDADLLTSETIPVIAGRAVTSPTMYDAVDAAPAGSVFQDGERIVSARLNRLPFKRKQYSVLDFVPEYCLNGFFCFVTNGLLPSLQSFSSLPYSQLVYSLVACMWVAAVPLASWLTMCAKAHSIRVIGIIGAVGILPAAYVFSLALLCPTVPLQYDVAGYILAVTAWFLTSGIFMYGRVSIAQRVQNGGHKALFWFGLSTQGASLLGAIVAFLLVNVFHVFRDPQLC